MDRTKMLITYFKLNEQELQERCLPASTQTLLRKKLFAVGSAHIVVLEENGSVTAYGDDRFGQCGVKGWTDIVKVAAGDFHTVGLRKNGTVAAVGDNTYGQCNVGQWKNIAELYATRNLTVGVTSDGSLLVASLPENATKEQRSAAAELIVKKMEDGTLQVLEQIASSRDAVIARLNRGVAKEPPVSIKETPPGQFNYSYSTGSVVINGYLGADSTVVIPRTIQEKPVTTIVKRAFFNNTKLRRLVLPDTLVKIEPEAFKGCVHLEELVFPIDAALNHIGDNAFAQCAALCELRLPQKLERISRWAFVQCASLKTVFIPEQIRSIGFGAFCECPKLEAVYISQDVQNRLGRLDLIVDNTGVIKVIN